MNMDPNLIAHQAYLNNLDKSYLGSAYDHSSPRLISWRAEREIAAMAIPKHKLDGKQKRSTLGTIVGWFRFPKSAPVKLRVHPAE
jgi:hypothetical protein